MNKINTPPPIFLKLENVYTVWHTYIIHFPKIHRYSIGAKIDNLFCDLISYISSAIFVKRENKLAYILKSIQILDTIKILLKVACNVEALDFKKYTHISNIITEIGKMLGGWHNQLIKDMENKKPHQ